MTITLSFALRLSLKLTLATNTQFNDFNEMKNSFVNFGDTKR